MTKFETVGVNYQHAARSLEEAKKAFVYSCNCCCNKGIRIDCDKCSIAFVHNLVVAHYADKGDVKQ